MITIALHRTELGTLSGTLTIDRATWAITDWRQGGDPGHIIFLADGGQTTLALGDRKPDGTRDGSICVNGPRWPVTGCRFDGYAMVGVAGEPEMDEWMRDFCGVADADPR